ncbi:MAG: hypothetical protein ACI814_005291 [Mariniblastus sp.]|jgi:hypothetical protein
MALRSWRGCDAVRIWWRAICVWHCRLLVNRLAYKLYRPVSEVEPILVLSSPTRRVANEKSVLRQAYALSSLANRSMWIAASAVSTPLLPTSPPARWMA